MAEVEKKIEKLEEKYLDEQIDGVTYRRWLTKYRKQIAVMKNDLDRAADILKGLYQMATMELQYELTKAVFKGKLVYSDGSFRTFAIALIFESNAPAINKKGLLVTSNPKNFEAPASLCTPDGS